MRKRYSSYEDARKRGGRDVWPGCAGDGACRPCGRVHDFGAREPHYVCWHNATRGCPMPPPEPEHKWVKGKGRCAECGRKARWVAPNGDKFDALYQSRLAKNGAWPRRFMRREGECETKGTTAESWNKRCPIGTRVCYWPVAGEPEMVESVTASAAWMIPGRAIPVVMVAGVSGCVLLTHVAVR